ncbi:MAG: WYL domain-containing protein [archaeon]
MVNSKEFSKEDLMELYKLLRLIEKGLIINPIEDWELDRYDEPLIDKKKLKNITKKIKKILEENELKKIDKALLIRKYSDWNNRVDEKVYDKIEKAYDNKQTIEISYFSLGKGEGIKREIDVYHKTRKYIIAYCHLRKAMRKFRTDRVVSAKITNKIYSIPENFDKNDY